MPCIAEYSAPSSSLTLLVIREKVAEGIHLECMRSIASNSALGFFASFVWQGFISASTNRVYPWNENLSRVRTLLEC